MKNNIHIILISGLLVTSINGVTTRGKRKRIANSQPSYFTQQRKQKIKKTINYDEQLTQKLLGAVNNNDVMQATKIIQIGNVNVCKKDEKGNTPLHCAIEHENKKLVQILLQHGASVRIKNKEGLTPLYAAVLRKNVSIVQLLLKEPYVSFKVKDKNRISLLKKIREEGFIDVAAACIQAGKISIKDLYGQCTLIKAAQEGKNALVQLFLKLNFYEANDAKEAFIWAAANGHIEVVKLFFMQLDINVNAQDHYKDTALTLAGCNGHVETVKLLLVHPEINVNIKNDDGDTALTLAAKNGHIEIVKLLLAHLGIDVDIEDCNQALICAAKNGYDGNGYDEIVKLLLTHPGINVNMKDRHGDTALSYAVENGDAETVKLLLAQPGIDVNAKNGRGDTALICAAKNGHDEIVKLLLTQLGIDVNAKNGRGDTALICAVENGDAETVKLLLAQPGIDVNAKNWHGNTALILAVLNGHADIVELLLAQPGIDINAKCDCGDTAFNCVVRKNHISILYLLLRSQIQITQYDFNSAHKEARYLLNCFGKLGIKALQKTIALLKYDIAHARGKVQEKKDMLQNLRQVLIEKWRSFDRIILVHALQEGEVFLIKHIKSIKEQFLEGSHYALDAYIKPFINVVEQGDSKKVIEFLQDGCFVSHELLQHGLTYTPNPQVRKIIYEYIDLYDDRELTNQERKQIFNDYVQKIVNN